jgi:streptogramin lyase
VHPTVKTSAAGDNPRDVVITGGMVWVVDLNDSTVRQFDLRGHQLRTVKLNGQSIAAGPNSVWVGELSNSNSGPQGPLAEVDAKSGRVLRTLTTKDSVDVLGVGDGAVWAASRFAPRITKIPLSGGPQRSFSLPGNPTAVAVSPKGVWVTFGHAGTAQAVGQPETGDGGVVELNPDSGAQLAEQEESAVPTALAVGKGTVWVALANDVNELDRISEATGRSEPPNSAITVGNAPTALAIGDGSVWALNYYDATVTRVDPATGRATAAVAFAAATDSDRLPATTPIRLAVSPGTLWVTDAQAGTLSRLSDK